MGQEMSNKYEVPGELILKLRNNGEITQTEFSGKLSLFKLASSSVPSEHGKQFKLVDKETKESILVECEVKEENGETVRLIKPVVGKKLNLPVTEEEKNSVMPLPETANLDKYFGNLTRRYLKLK